MKGLRYYGCALYGVILLAFAVAEDILMRGLWRPFDITTYYGLAADAAASVEAALGAPAVPPLLLFDVGGPRIYLVCLIIFAGAVLVMEIGRKRYGDEAGALAGLLFTLNVAWALGQITVGEALCVALILLSAYALLGDRYLLAGFLSGAAACIKPLALLMLPASLLFAGRLRKAPGLRVPAFTGAALAPLILISIMAFSTYGGNVMTMAAESGFQAAGFYTSEPADPLMAVAGIVLAACMLASMLPLALLGYARRQGPVETYFLAAGLCFIASLALRQYFHYWFLGLPFLAILCAGAFGRPADE